MSEAAEKLEREADSIEKDDSVVVDGEVKPDILRRTEAADLGVRDETAEALRVLRVLREKIANLIGDVNSEANSNHYNAARREAANQPVKFKETVMTVAPLATASTARAAR